MLETQHAIEALQQHQPQFHPRTHEGPKEAFESYFSRGARKTPLERTSWGLNPRILDQISNFLSPDMTSLETGGGYSTVMLGSTVRKHICINPDVTGNILVKNFIKDHSLSRVDTDLVFVENSSDKAFTDPVFDTVKSIDFALIDGNHSFPYPVLDWHYADKLLKIGATLALDDCHIPSVKLMADYLLVDQGYQLIKKAGTLWFFEKKASQRLGWKDQPINKDM